MEYIHIHILRFFIFLIKNFPFKICLSRERKITSVECVRVVIDRIREIDAILTCVVDSRYEDAIRLKIKFHHEFVTFKTFVAHFLFCVNFFIVEINAFEND